MTSACGPAHDLALLPRYRLSVLPVASGVNRVLSRLTLRVAQVGLQCVIADAEHAACLPLVLTASLEHEPDIPASPGAQRFLPIHGLEDHVAVSAAEPGG